MIKRMLTQYECEVCGKRSFNRNEIQACEISIIIQRLIH